MTHKDLRKLFSTLFPIWETMITEWWPNGKNSIRIRVNKHDFIFTYNSPKEWSFETVDNFITRIKK